jgi:small subunit ribosomal protein S18
MAERRKKRSAGQARRPRRKRCYFCAEQMEYIDYKDAELLRRFISDRAKIRGRRATGCCAKHQRRLALAIKNAREMMLLPYVQRAATERLARLGGREHEAEQAYASDYTEEAEAAEGLEEPDITQPQQSQEQEPPHSAQSDIAEGVEVAEGSVPESSQHDG